MKRSSKWDQKVIENQLKKMPEIKDKQSKAVLYERIQAKLQEEQIKPRKVKSWFLPGIATAAVFFLLLLIIPSFLNNNEENLTLEESAEDEAGIMMEVNDYQSENEADSAQTEFAPNFTITDNLINKNYLAAVQPFEEQQLGEALVTIAVPVSFETGEFVIPVTVQAPVLRKLDQFIEVKNNFNGEHWGIGSFPPIQINSITEEKAGVVIIDIPTGSLESISSANDSLYKLALKETFAILDYEEIQLTSDGESGVIWGQQGPLHELDIPAVNRGYYLFESNTDYQFLVRGRTVKAPRSTEQQVSFQETLELMKSGDPEKGYLASIPEEVGITNIDQTADTVTITFTEGAIIEDKVEYLIMLEAIMFTAKDFGIQFIEFQGVELDRIGPYVSGDVIEIPKFINFIR